MFLVICFALLITFIYWYLTKNFDYWKSRGVNGPKPLPIFGNLLDPFFFNRTELELKYYRKYGSVYGYYSATKPVLVVGDPELIKMILVKDFHIFPQRRATVSTHPVMKFTLTNITGNDWKRVRSILSPTFTSGKMKLMFPLIEECLNELTNHLETLAKTKSNVDFRKVCGLLSLNVMASCAFATNLNALQQPDSPYVKHAKRLNTINQFRVMLLRMVPKFLFEMFGMKAERNSADTSQAFFVNVVQEMIEKRKNNKNGKFNDLLQLLIDAEHIPQSQEVDDDDLRHHHTGGKEELEMEKEIMEVKLNNANKNLSEAEVIASAISFLMIGYETTAATLTYVTYELALNPHVQDKLFEEISSSLDSNRRLDYNVLCRLPYLDSVVSEALRRHPPVLKTFRIAHQEYKLGNTGITVYRGQEVDIPIYAIHHDERFYKNPFEFNPDRFMPCNRHNLIPYTFLPFGGGPRNCIAMRFALLEVKSTIAHMIQKFTFHKCDETDVPLIYDRKTLLIVPKRTVVGVALRN